MKHILSFLFLIIISSSCEGNPKILFSSTEHNFGNVKQHKIIEKIFNFTNTGTTELHIKKVRSG